ncbi:hypothetical protein Tco_1219276 [Tanacetum coccineum]
MVGGGMERSFISQKGNDTPIGVASTVQEGVTPSVVDMTVETEKQNYLEDTTVLGSFPPLSTPGTTTVSNAPGVIGLMWLSLSSYARAMIELQVDVELKDNIVVAMPKITREGYYTCNVRVEYEWKPPRCSSCKVFEHIHEECPKNTCAGEKKTVKKPSQTSRGVLVAAEYGSGGGTS